MKLIDPSKAWYVAKTYNADKAAENLRLAGFDAYLPRKVVEKKDRRTNVYHSKTLPVMPYIFIAMPPDAEHRHFGFAKACDGVSYFVGTKAAPIAFDGELVVEFQVREMAGDFDELREDDAATKKAKAKLKFPEGSSAQVTDGAFADFIGVVLKHEKTGRIKLAIDLFGRETPVEFEAGQLKPAA